MAGYYHERKATGTRDPLKAKAIVFCGDGQRAAFVACDLIGIAADLSAEVRRLAAAQTGIPAAHIVLAATHSHTAPDYTRDLYEYLGGPPADGQQRYAAKLIGGIVDAIVRADAGAQPAAVLRRNSAAGDADLVQSAVRHARRQRADLDAAGQSRGRPRRRTDRPRRESDAGAGGRRGSAAGRVHELRAAPGYGRRDAVERRLPVLCRADAASDTGTERDFGLRQRLLRRHQPRRSGGARPSTRPSSSASHWAGQCTQGLTQLTRIEQPVLRIRTAQVALPLQEITAEDVARALPLGGRRQGGKGSRVLRAGHGLQDAGAGPTAQPPPLAPPGDAISWGLSRTWAGVGDRLPVDVQVIALGQDLAIVCLSGEVFVDLGLAIKRASPFRTTLVVELCNCVETIYVPPRVAYAVGSYEVTNSALQPGSGEMLAETAVRLLRDARGDEAAAAAVAVTGMMRSRRHVVA